MKKEKTIRTYQRRTKTGKVVTVKQHTAKYDAAEALKEVAKKKGAGDELENLKKKVKPEKVKVEKPAEDAPDYGFTADEYKAWYHWDQDADPKNAAAKKVEKALKAKMGAKGYKKYFDEMTDSYSSRGHNKAFKALDAEAAVPKKDAKTPKSASTKSVTSGKETMSVKGPKESPSKKEITNYFGTKDDLEKATKKLDGSLKSKGFYARVAGSGIEVYKKGDRPSLKNLQAAIHGKDYVSWGPNENNVGLRNTVESAIKQAFGSSKKKK